MSSYINANVYRLQLNTTFNSNWENLRMSQKKGILIFGISLEKNTRFSQKFGFLLIFFFRNSEFYSKKKFRIRNSEKSEIITEPLYELQKTGVKLLVRFSIFSSIRALEIQKLLGLMFVCHSVIQYHLTFNPL